MQKKNKPKLLQIKGEEKLAIAVALFSLAVIFIVINIRMSFSTVTLEIRHKDKAAFIERDSFKNRYKASNNPDGCQFNNGKQSYLQNLVLAYHLSNPLLYKLKTDVHDDSVDIEHVITITNKDKKYQYYYTANRPQALQSVINNLYAPWSKELASLGFN